MYPYLTNLDARRFWNFLHAGEGGYVKRGTFQKGKKKGRSAQRANHLVLFVHSLNMIRAVQKES